MDGFAKESAPDEPDTIESPSRRDPGFDSTGAQAHALE